MHVVIAPDSFKGSLEADKVAMSLAAGMRRGHAELWREATFDLVPMADGGEGTAATLCRATGGRMESRRVTGPLGERVDASFAVLGDGQTAVVEMAAASGLPLIPPERRDPLRATTRGTGELILAALDAGCRRLIIGIGGSATNDGGAGMAQALGVKLLRADGSQLPPGGAALEELDRVESDGIDPRLASVEVWVACDVDNPLLGPQGASHVFGPQKGATPEMVRRLDAALRRYADIIQRDVGIDVRNVPGSGAAGGLGAGLLAFTSAVLRPGVELVSEAVGLGERVARANLVVTGEGAIDGQTRRGKVVAGVAKHARAHGVPVVAVGGTLAADAASLVPEVVDAVFSIVPGPMSLERAMTEAPALLEEAGQRLANVLGVGASIR